MGLRDVYGGMLSQKILIIMGSLKYPCLPSESSFSSVSFFIFFFYSVLDLATKGEDK